MLPTLLIVLCVLLRVVPHPPNFAPVGATAVFAGRTLKPCMAIVVGDIVWSLVLSATFRLVAGRLESRPLWVPVPTKQLAVV